jgi:hypothetical protein
MSNKFHFEREEIALLKFPGEVVTTRDNEDSFELAESDFVIIREREIVVDDDG